MRSLRDLASLTFRHTASLAALASGATERQLARRRGGAVILMYHRILPDTLPVGAIEPGMYVRASTFERQLVWLSQRFIVRTLGELLHEPPPAGGTPSAVITFDDGWRDNLTVAWPLLRRYGLRATLFAVRDWVAAGRHDGGEFIRPEELHVLAAEGLEIGAHTASHPRLDRVDRAAALAEMRDSKEAIELWTERPCELFAYPYGAHAPAAVEAARSLFRGSVVTGGGWWSPACDQALLPRVAVHQDMTSTLPLFAARVCGAT